MEEKSLSSDSEWLRPLQVEIAVIIDCAKFQMASALESESKLEKLCFPVALSLSLSLSLS